MAKTNNFRLKPVSIREFLDIANDPDYRITSTPFGTPPGEDKIVASTAVSWKGKGKEAMPEGAQKGLEKAIDISKGCSGKEGTAVFHGKEMPQKAVCQIEKAGA